MGTDAKSKFDTLFITCPDCFLEEAIKRDFGKDVFFASSMGAEISAGELDTTSTIQHLITQEGLERVGIGLKADCKYENEVKHYFKLGLSDQLSDSVGSHSTGWKPSSGLCEAAQTRLYELSGLISRLGLPDDRHIKVFAVLYRDDLDEHQIVSPRKN